MNARRLIVFALSFVIVAPLVARPLGKLQEDLGYTIVAGGQLGERAAAADGITFTLKNKDGSETAYRLTHLRLPQGEPAQEAAKAALHQCLTREKVAVYANGKVVADDEGNSFHLAFVNTARGLLSSRLMADGLADTGGAEAPVPDGTSTAAYQEELMKTFRAAESREAGQFGDLKAPPPDNRININTATAIELQELPGIGPSTAGKIIDARPIRSLARLKKIDGIGSKTWEDIEDRVKIRD